MDSFPESFELSGFDGIKLLVTRVVFETTACLTHQDFLILRSIFNVTQPTKTSFVGSAQQR